MNGAGLGVEVFDVMGVSLRVSILATGLATLISVPLGFAIAVNEFSGKRAVVTVINTLMAMPTVVVGLLVYILLSRAGPFGFLGILYTPTAMVVGQVILAVPIITALSYASVSSVDRRVRRTAETLGASGSQSAWMVLKEARLGIMAAAIAGFGRVIAEVGSAIMVGGNIKGYTRTMTTTIALETSKGNFALGISLGIILLVVALSINMMVGAFLGHRT